MWAFSRHRPQLYADSPATLAMGVTRHTFGRAVSPVVQCGLAVAVLLPGARKMVTARNTRFEPACGWDFWRAEVAPMLPPVSGRSAPRWLYYASSWRKRRSSAIVLHGRSALAFLSVEHRTEATFHPQVVARSVSQGPSPPAGFRVPGVLEERAVGDWLIRRLEPLPALHRALTPSEPSTIRGLGGQVEEFLRRQPLPRPAAPSHWAPMHGDFVPWNLRRDLRGQVWVLDWEDAGWGPPLADLVRYASSAESLSSRPSAESASRARNLVGGNEEQVAEAARFWLAHRNLAIPRGRPGMAPADLTQYQGRVRHERSVLQALSGGEGTEGPDSGGEVAPEDPRPLPSPRPGSLS